MTKLYYCISEVARITGVQPHTLRAWEKEFACLQPRRAGGKNRAYRDRDIAVVLLLKRLLYEERYTAQGVRQRLRCEPELVSRCAVEPAAAGLTQDPTADAGAALPRSGGQTLRSASPQLHALLRLARAELRQILHLLER